MDYIYKFDEESIPFWIHALFYVLYLIPSLYFCYKLVLDKKRYAPSFITTFFFLLYFSLFVVFYCIGTDYFRYRDWVFSYDFSDWEKERIYLYLIYLCRKLPTDYPFEVFRLIVWGGALMLVFRSGWLIRKYVEPGLVVILLFVLYSAAFSYARASLAMSVYFVGLTLFTYAKKIEYKVLAMGLVISSYYFHHEMIVGILLLPCLFIPFEKKKNSYFAIVGLIVVIFIISFFFSNTEVLDSVFDNDDLSSKIEDINEQEQGNFRFSTFIRYLTYFYPFYLITKAFWLRKVPKTFVELYRIIFGVLLTSVAFMAVSGLRSIYVYRIMYIAMIPLALLLSYCYCNRLINNKEFVRILVITLLSRFIGFMNT